MDSRECGLVVSGGLSNAAKENIVLFDWLSVTSKILDVQQIKHILGLGNVPWQEIKGARGYRDRQYFSCISIHYNGRPEMGVWLEMSGQGCRTFESLSKVGWLGLFQSVFQFGMNITRLDVAYDDHTGILDITRIAKDTLKKEYISKSDSWDVHLSNKGSTVMIGSADSKVRVRIYDKAAERKKFDEHWVRVELQLRDDRALQFMNLTEPLGQAFLGVLLNYIRYVEPSSDSNKWRWPMKDYWRNLVENVERISIYKSPGMEYNEERCRNYVVNQAGNAIDACLRMYGMEEFQRMISDRKIYPNPKYDFIVQQHFQKVKGDEKFSVS